MTKTEPYIFLENHGLSGITWPEPDLTYIYSFGQGDYIRFMPYDKTDQFKGRRHICPICGRKVWSCWGHADLHWRKHAIEK